jgi:hypothetical protein
MANLPFEDVSAEVKTVGATMRPKQPRDPRGRYRSSRQMTALGPAGGVGKGGRNAVTGEWLDGIEDRSVRHRERDGWAEERVHYVSPDWSGGYLPERRTHEATAGAQAALNGLLGNPCHTSGAAVCNGQ